MFLCLTWRCPQGYVKILSQEGVLWEAHFQAKDEHQLHHLSTIIRYLQQNSILASRVPGEEGNLWHLYPSAIQHNCLQTLLNLFVAAPGSSPTAALDMWRLNSSCWKPQRAHDWQIVPKPDSNHKKHLWKDPISLWKSRGIKSFLKPVQENFNNSRLSWIAINLITLQLSVICAFFVTVTFSLVAFVNLGGHCQPKRVQLTQRCFYVSKTNDEISFPLK